MVVTSIKARHATIKFKNAAVTYDTPTALNAETYDTGTIASFKNLTITPPRSDTEQIPLLGETAQTIGAGFPSTGAFQNAALDEKNWTNAKFSGTLVLRGDEDFEALPLGGGTAITGGYTRYMAGASTASKTRVVANAILLDFYNGSERVSAVFNNAICNFGDIKYTGSDGHLEIDVDGECLPESWGIEYLD